MHAQMPEGSVQVVILFQSNFAVWNFVCASREGIQPDMLLYLYMGATMPGTSGRMMCC